MNINTVINGLDDRTASRNLETAREAFSHSTIFARYSFIIGNGRGKRKSGPKSLIARLTR